MRLGGPSTTGHRKTATRERLGKAALSSSSRLPLSSASKHGYPCDVPPRSREAGDEFLSDRITHTNKDDGDGTGGLLGSLGRRPT